MTVTAAVAVLVGVLALATVLGMLLRARTGRARTGRTSTRGVAADTADLAPAEAFGTAATLVQFSTPTCARCPATRRQLDAVASATPGVTRLEIDLAERPELARRFAVMQTPTVLLLDRDRTVRTRFGGPPRPADLTAALDTVLTTGHQESR
ncbi:thioredoxin family protein [Curtobacterium pusillum]|uniref:TlpA family protein disulfide reductase n=1 Tax=Curtobacterium pusillum TaxID=69373 RepID=UPI0011A208E1|nr:thioredoxin family protein [Curtobacterium pusillum]